MICLSPAPRLYLQYSRHEWKFEAEPRPGRSALAHADGEEDRFEETMTSNAPLMPKATAIWLVENTSLTFDQIAEFCKLHPLEVKAIADGDAAQGIKGLDPVLTGQLSRE